MPRPTLFVEIASSGDPREDARMVRRASLLVEDGITFADVTDDLGERVGAVYLVDATERIPVPGPAHSVV